MRFFVFGALCGLAACTDTLGTTTIPTGSSDATDSPTATDTVTETATSETTDGATDTVTDGTTPTTPVDDSAQQLCVDEINRYRDTLGLPPYERWKDAESCTDGEAQADSESGVPHSAFPSCGEWAQNECPGWPGNYSDVIVGCLAMMWDEGPGADFSLHGHYINMSSPDYTRVSCGFYTTPEGAVWATQDFQ